MKQIDSLIVWCLIVMVLCFLAAGLAFAYGQMVKNQKAKEKLEALPEATPAARIGGTELAYTVITFPTGERFFVVGNYRGISCAQIQPVKP